MSQGVVDPLEVVEIHEHQCVMVLRLLTILQGLLKTVMKGHPIRKSCDIINKGDVTDPVLCLTTSPQRQGGLTDFMGMEWFLKIEKREMKSEKGQRFWRCPFGIDNYKI
jgi:hypothetical protein